MTKSHESEKNESATERRKPVWPELEDLELLRDASADPTERAFALDRLASDGFFYFDPEEVEPLAWELTTHEEDTLRGTAIKRLLMKSSDSPRASQYLERGIEALHRDPSSNVRQDAAFGLFCYAARRPEVRERVMKELMRRVADEGEEASVRARCYEYLVELVSGEDEAARSKIEQIGWELTTHEEDTLRGTAIEELLKNFSDSPRASQYLERGIEMLHHDPSWSVRDEAASGLRYYADMRPEVRERVMKELMRRVADEGEADLVRASCYEELVDLVRREDEAARSKVEQIGWELTTHEEYILRGTAILELLENFSDSPRASQYLERGIEMLRHDPSSDVRDKAALGLRYYAARRPEVRERVMEELARWEAASLPEVMEKLIRRVADEGEEAGVRASCYEKLVDLVRREDEAARSKVEQIGWELTTHEEEELRGTAIEELLKNFSDSPRASQYLERGIEILHHDPSSDVRCYAASGLRYYADMRPEGRERVMKELMRRVADEGEEAGVRASCYEKLVGLVSGEDEAARSKVEQIGWELTTHEEDTLRGTAIEELLMNFSDSPRASQYLERGIEMLHHDPSSDVRDKAAFGLSWYAARRPEGRERVMEVLMRRVADEGEEAGVRASCYENLADLVIREDEDEELVGLVSGEDEAARSEIERMGWELTTHEEEELRGRAILKLLENFSDSPRASQYLERGIEMLHHDPSSDVRRDAVFGLSWYAARRPEGRERVMKELMRRVADREEDESVRDTCRINLKKLYKVL